MEITFLKLKLLKTVFTESPSSKPVSKYIHFFSDLPDTDIKILIHCIIG